MIKIAREYDHTPEGIIVTECVAQFARYDHFGIEYASPEFELIDVDCDSYLLIFDQPQPAPAPIMTVAEMVAQTCADIESGKVLF